MDILFLLLVGGLFLFIIWKTVELNRGSKKSDDENTGGGAGTGAGEVPKDFKK
jgi:hypothetical protein